MLPHFHAAGHIAYAKSAHLYTQQMLELPHKMPAEEYRQFTEKGFFTIGYWRDFRMECFQTKPSSNSVEARARPTRRYVRPTSHTYSADTTLL